ncbi:MAG: hypothetical protein NHB32_00205 [Fischerella sp. CENA71]|nr:hypothetical protein [Fischerella sp. CENA71]
MKQTNINNLDTATQHSKQSHKDGKKIFKIVENNYRNNLESDYTEKIKELDRNFHYSNNSNHYWTEPEQSILYGTPLYDVASSTQKIALNHLFWVSQYNYAAYSEIETIDYNQITADCFSNIGSDYEIISRQLEHESAQERVHIHAFFKVNYQTIKALLDNQAFSTPIGTKLSEYHQIDLQLSNYQYYALRFITKMMLTSKQRYDSPYLRKLEETRKFTSATTRGFFHGRGVIPSHLVRFFALNWGSSPFLASQYYTVRFIGNMLLKNQEHSMFAYFKKINNQDNFVPIPTALSYYHFLDEAFHTSTSLFLAREIQKTFPKPTAYEKFLINLAVYLIQRINLSQLSGVVRNRFFGDDISGMIDIYRLLKSSIFAMSHKEAVHWVERCFCYEHEGFHQSAQSHKRLLSEARQLCEHLDYLWPANREMHIMAEGGSIDKAVRNNIKTFKQFSKLSTSLNQ